MGFHAFSRPHHQNRGEVSIAALAEGLPPAVHLIPLDAISGGRRVYHGERKIALNTVVALDGVSTGMKRPSTAHFVGGTINDDDKKEEGEKNYFVDTKPLKPLQTPVEPAGKTSMSRSDAINYGLVFLASVGFGASRLFDKPARSAARFYDSSSIGRKKPP